MRLKTSGKTRYIAAAAVLLLCIIGIVLLWQRSGLTNEASAEVPADAQTAPASATQAAPAGPAGPAGLAAAAASFAPPALVDPVSPLQFGAKCDGVTDDSAAFQAALDHADVRVPSATCVIDRTVVIHASHRHLECVPGATLKRTNPYAQQMFNVVADDDATLTDDSIANCRFVGANTATPQFTVDDERQNDIPIETQDRVSHFVLVGNTFARFFGQSMFQTYGRVDGGSGDVIAFNRFESCGYYGPVFDAHVDGYIGHNVLVDCAIGVENDNPGQRSGGNVIEYNTVSAVHGYGAPDMRSAAMLTGGAAGGANYSGNVVRYNVVSGTSDGARADRGTQPARIWQKSNGTAARYLGNTCTNGCEVVR